MTASMILRSEDGNASPLARALDLAHAADQPANNTVVSKHVSQPDPLQSEVARLREAIVAAEAKQAQLVSQARELGRSDAIAAFKRDEAKAMDMLEAGLTSALATFKHQIAELERLSLGICNSALSKVLADPKRYPDLVEGAIHRQLDIIKASAIVAIRVSPSDYPDAQSLAKLAARLSLTEGSAQHDKSLTAGNAGIVMRLGHVDVSIPEYLEKLQNALTKADIRGGERS